MQCVFTPIGVFRSDARYSYDVPRQGTLSAEGNGVVELLPGKGFAEAAADLAGFSRVWLIFLFDRNVGIWHPKVQPPRHVDHKVGVFATRSPYRPNPIGLTCAELVGVQGNKVFVKSHDLLDGTPILDLKPYLPYADAFPEARAGWTEAPELLYNIEYSELAARQLAWLAAHGVSCLGQFIRTRLESEPLNAKRNRLVPEPQRPEGTPLLAYRTWRVRFVVDEALRTVRVLEVLSGYREEELSPDAQDTYADKQCHREFLAQFATPRR